MVPVDDACCCCGLVSMRQFQCAEWQKEVAQLPFHRHGQ